MLTNPFFPSCQGPRYPITDPSPLVLSPYLRRSITWRRLPSFQSRVLRDTLANLRSSRDRVFLPVSLQFRGTEGTRSAYRRNISRVPAEALSRLELLSRRRRIRGFRGESAVPFSQKFAWSKAGEPPWKEKSWIFARNYRRPRSLISCTRTRGGPLDNISVRNFWIHSGRL